MSYPALRLNEQSDSMVVSDPTFKRRTLENVIQSLRAIPVAGRDGMLLNLSGAHAPFFTRNLLVLTVASMEAYAELTERLFAHDTNVRRFRTSVALGRLKAGMQLPLPSFTPTPPAGATA